MKKLKIYTDGSSRGNPSPHCGSGWVIAQNDKVIFSGNKYIPDATNNIAEMTAVIEGLKRAKDFIDSDGFEMVQVSIHSDSAYIVNCINNRWYSKWKNNGWKTASGSSVKNKELWVELINLTQELDAIFIKVKGHSGDELNELADTLAKQASAMEGRK